MGLEFEFYVLETPSTEIQSGHWGDMAPSNLDVRFYSFYESHFWEGIMAPIRQAFTEEVEMCIPEYAECL